MSEYKLHMQQINQNINGDYILPCLSTLISLRNTFIHGYPWGQIIHTCLAKLNMMNTILANQIMNWFQKTTIRILTRENDYHYHDKKIASNMDLTV
ncbi:hypothetical protein I4U23_004290 [Adineta vaga]|nr:hypothetical protein I4U23_004290 [Adineta vaga]